MAKITSVAKVRHSCDILLVYVNGRRKISTPESLKKSTGQPPEIFTYETEKSEII